MSYTEEIREGAVRPGSSAVLDADSTGATGVHGEYLVMKRLKVKRLMALVSTVISGAAEVEFKRRPTPGSATGEVSLGTLSIPDTTAVGQMLYKDIDPVLLNAGEAISFEVSSAGTSGAVQ